MAEHLEPEDTPEENAPVRNGHRYLVNRIDCLDYPRALRLELPIGSGLIESGHRHVLQARLKKGGAAWLVENAALYPIWAFCGLFASGSAYVFKSHTVMYTI